MSENIPSNADRYQMAVSLYLNGRFSEAVATIEPHISDERDWQVLALAAACASEMEKHEDAQAYWLRVIHEKPDYADAHNDLGRVFQKLKRFPEAEAAYRRAIDIRPELMEAHYNIGLLLQQARRLPEAEAAYESALAIAPDYTRAHNNLGQALLDSGALDEGIGHCRHAASLDPENAMTHSNLAFALAFQSEDGQDVLAECRRWCARHEFALRQ